MQVVEPGYQRAGYDPTASKQHHHFQQHILELAARDRNAALLHPLHQHQLHHHHHHQYLSKSQVDAGGYRALPPPNDVMNHFPATRRLDKSARHRSLDSSSEEDSEDERCPATRQEKKSPRSSSRASSMSESSSGSPQASPRPKSSAPLYLDGTGSGSSSSDQLPVMLGTPLQHLAALFALHSSATRPEPAQSLDGHGSLPGIHVPTGTPHQTRFASERSGPSSSFAFDASYEEEALHKRPVIDWDKEFRNEVGSRHPLQQSAITTHPNVRSCPDPSSLHLRPGRTLRPTPDSPWMEAPDFPTGTCALSAADSLRVADSQGTSTSATSSPSDDRVPESAPPAQRAHRRRQRHEIPPEARVCAMCLTSKTGQWRADAEGKPTLCNACGLRLRNKSRRRTLKFIDESSNVGQKRHRSNSSGSGDSSSGSGSGSSTATSTSRRGSVSACTEGGHTREGLEAVAERAAKLFRHSPPSIRQVRKKQQQQQPENESESGPETLVEVEKVEKNGVVPRRSTIYSLLN